MKLTSHFSWFIVHVVFCIYIYAILSKFTKDMQDALAYTGEPGTKQTCKRDDLPNLHHDSEVVVRVQYCLDLFGGFTPLRNWKIWIIFDGICHSHCTKGYKKGRESMRNRETISINACRRQPEWVVNWYADIKHPCCLVKFSCLLVKFQSIFCPFCPTIVPGTKANQGTSPGSEGVIHHALDSVKNLLIGHQLLQFQVIQLGSADVKIGWAWFLQKTIQKCCIATAFRNLWWMQLKFSKPLVVHVPSALKCCRPSAEHSVPSPTVGSAASSWDDYGVWSHPHWVAGVIVAQPAGREAPSFSINNSWVVMVIMGDSFLFVDSRVIFVDHFMADLRWLQAQNLYTMGDLWRTQVKTTSNPH